MLRTVCWMALLGLMLKEGSPHRIVINTWPVTNSTMAAWTTLLNNGSAVDAVVSGCSQCEAQQCRGTVGANGSPDENGETTLDAMIMDGTTMDVGAVGCLRRVKTAIAVARAVMDHTTHTLLVGDLATKFALEMGFAETNLTGNRSLNIWKDWKSHNCQPNFRENVTPDPKHNCGPYQPKTQSIMEDLQEPLLTGNYIESHPDPEYDVDNHDTIGMIVIDQSGSVSAGTSTNGLTHKVPGRVGDSPIMGAGSYAMNGAGGAAATGNGDIMMRFLPSYNAVIQMQNGVDPVTALQKSMAPIIKFYPSFRGAMIAVNKDGKYGAVCHGYTNWTFCVADDTSPEVQLHHIDCKNSMKNVNSANTHSLAPIFFLIIFYNIVFFLLI
ncbi:N(4)-(Beta-N-acetylglucosaminyl)-L-asparaginase-like [Saccostrea cucullata]|uniref:N(4)-(Beta-N-acetylglucosaminyl)-L-asparaginase- like n=1 Tax=Saccostrea cuccullata TaxID=36930 RepID=UPI002ED00CB2